MQGFCLLKSTWIDLNRSTSICIHLYLSVLLFHLLHQLLENMNELIDCLLMSLPDIVRHTGADMVCKKNLIETVQRRICRCNLNKNIRAVRILLHHSLNPPNPCTPSPNALWSCDGNSTFFHRFLWSLSFLPCDTPIYLISHASELFQVNTRGAYNSEWKTVPLSNYIPPVGIFNIARSSVSVKYSFSQIHPNTSQ